MINQAVETLPEMAETSSTNRTDKKNWTKPALGRFDIGSATRNAGVVVDDGQHALGNS